MDLTVKVREKIITLSKYSSMTQRQIAQECQVSLASVNKFVRLSSKNLSTSPKRKGKCGRKRKTSPRDDKMLLKNSIINPTKTSTELNTDLQYAGINIDPSTVRRRLLEFGRTARRPYKKQLLTTKMKAKRLAWAKKYKDWTVDNWKNVLFSDESHFEVHGQRSQYVRRSKGEPIKAVHLVQTVKHPLKKMFWGCFSFIGVGPLCPVIGMMNSARYIDVLKYYAVPTLKIMKNRSYPIFQQDLAPCHTSKAVKKYFSEHSITVLDWPGNSPDVNPIENLWAIMKAKLRKLDCSTLLAMETSINNIWYDPDVMDKICQNLVESKPNRVRDLIAKKGGHIKY